MKIIERALKAYSTESESKNEKVTVLFIINSMLSCAFLVFATIRIMSGNYIVAMGELVLFVLLAINIFILIRGHYRFCSNLSIVLFLLACFAIFIIQDHGESNDIYIFSTYLLSVICVTPLMSYRLWQMIAVVAIGIVGQLVIFMAIFVPMAKLTGETAIGGKFIISMFFMCMASFFAILVFRSQLNSIDRARDAKENSDKNLKELNALITAMKGSYDMGERLLDAAEKSGRTSEIVSSNLQDLQNISVDLQRSSGNRSVA
nr:hypothetical protein [Spirochaetaceae bacterium]